MKIVTTYVAFDDEEFSQMEDCLAYEQHYMDLMVEIDECYAMYDKGMNPLPYMYAHNVEEALDEFCRQYDKCDYMMVKKVPSTDAVTFIWDYFGLKCRRGFVVCGITILEKESGRRCKPSLLFLDV